MIDRQGGVLIFECDTCGETFTGESDDFKAEWAAAKEEGWRTRKIMNEWIHLCINCETKKDPF